MKNLSEFARMAMSKLVGPQAGQDVAVHARIDDLRKRLELISVEMRTLSGHLSQPGDHEDPLRFEVHRMNS
jgi:hypothetical protein